MNRLRFLRNEKGESLQKLSKYLNVTIQTISNYETGKREMSPDTIIKLANYFGVSTDYLLGNSDERNGSTKLSDDDIDIAFYEGYKDLADDDKEVMRSTLEAFLKKNKKK